MGDSQKNGTPWEKGDEGECQVSKLLEKLRSEYRVIEDIKLEKEDASTPLPASTQIDHVVLSVYGIFIIETKNLGGIYWSNKNIRDSVCQNKMHIEVVAEFLKVSKDDMFSIVVSAGDAKLPTEKPKECIYKKDLIKHIHSQKNKKRFTEQEVCFFYDEIKENNIRSKEEENDPERHGKYVRYKTGKNNKDERAPEKTRIEQEGGIAKLNQTKNWTKHGVAIVILLALLVGTLVYLTPRLNISSSTPPSKENIPPTPPNNDASTATDAGEFRAQFMEQLARYESEVEPKIDEIRLNDWAGEKYAELQNLKARAIESFSRGDYLAAREDLRQAQARVTEASAEYAERLATAKREAQEAFSNDRAPEAEKAVQQALRLNPDDPEMQTLEKRITVMSQVLDLLRQAEVAQNENRLEKEIAALQEALSIDPSRKAVESRLKELQAQLKQQRFADAMRKAQRALDADALAAAEKHIALAKTISPASQDLGVLQKRLAQARTEKAFAAQISLGEQAQARDDWSGAVAHFERARQLKPGNKTAVEKHDFARRAADVTKQIRRNLKDEHRLGDKNVLASVSAYLRETEPVVEASPGLKKIHAELARKADLYGIEVDVVVVSDNATHIIVRGEGQVGKTSRRTIRLRPGRRVFEGTRSGYQSKLVTVDIAPGAPTVEVTVVCDEKI